MAKDRAFVFLLLAVGWAALFNIGFGVPILGSFLMGLVFSGLTILGYSMFRRA